MGIEYWVIFVIILVIAVVSLPEYPIASILLVVLYLLPEKEEKGSLTWYKQKPTKRKHSTLRDCLRGKRYKKPRRKWYS